MLAASRDCILIILFVIYGGPQKFCGVTAITILSVSARVPAAIGCSVRSDGCRTIRRG